MTSMPRSGSTGQIDKVCIKIATNDRPSIASSYQFVIDLEADHPGGHQCAGLAMADGHAARIGEPAAVFPKGNAPQKAD